VRLHEVSSLMMEENGYLKKDICRWNEEKNKGIPNFCT